MQTRLFFLLPYCSPAAILSANYSIFTVGLFFAICATVSFLLFVYYRTTQKTLYSTIADTFHNYFTCFAIVFLLLSFPTELKNKFMNCVPSRLVMYNTDIMKVTDCSETTASRKMQQVKDAKGKLQHQEVTIKEYTEYFGLDYTEVCKFLNLIK